MSRRLLTFFRTSFLGTAFRGPAFRGAFCLGRLFLGTLCLGPLVSGPAAAHELGFTETLVILKANGTYQVDMICDLDALALGVSSQTEAEEVVARLRQMDDTEFDRRQKQLQAYFQRRVRVRFDGVVATPTVSFPDHGTPRADEAEIVTVFGLTARLEGQIPDGAQSLTFRASRSFPIVHLTVLRQDQASHREILQKGTPSSELALAAGPVTVDRWQVAGRYLVLGFWHILPAGLDHILFVLGLFLLSAKLKPLLFQVSAFTAAHTITLALSTYDVVSAPPAIVEPLIAISIAYVAIENIFTQELKPWRVWVVFAFGLLHGLGFAGVLGELGLPREELVTALLSFNIGVEVGQLTVLLVAFLGLGWLSRRSYYHRLVVVPLSVVIAITGLYWAIQRAFF